jgi:hypothetical protein
MILKSVALFKVISGVTAANETPQVQIPTSEETKSNNAESPSKSPALTPRAYGKLKSANDRPKVPRQIREIQENLTFEKIRRTGTKNNAR